MIKVTPFIETSGSDKFKQFLATPFTIDMLYPIFNDKSCETLFEGWKGKNMLSWYKFTNDNECILEFYADYYVIKKAIGKIKTVVYQLPLPTTINAFINDMQRFGIQLYWMQWIDDNFEPKDYLHKDGIRAYYEDLLGKMDKSFELL